MACGYFVKVFTNVVVAAVSYCCITCLCAVWQKRDVLEETGELDTRISALDDDLSDDEDEEESDDDGDQV